MTWNECKSHRVRMFQRTKFGCVQRTLVCMFQSKHHRFVPKVKREPNRRINIAFYLKTSNQINKAIYTSYGSTNRMEISKASPLSHLILARGMWLCLLAFWFCAICLSFVAVNLTLSRNRAVGSYWNRCLTCWFGSCVFIQISRIYNSHVLDKTRLSSGIFRGGHDGRNVCLLFIGWFWSFPSCFIVAVCWNFVWHDKLRMIY